MNSCKIHRKDSLKAKLNGDSNLGMFDILIVCKRAYDIKRCDMLLGCAYPHSYVKSDNFRPTGHRQVIKD